MEAVRRAEFLFSVLAIDILLGTLGLCFAFMIVTPSFILWFMSWDEKRHTRIRKQQQARYVHRKLP